MLWGWPFSVWELIVKISLWTAVGAGVVTAVAAFVAGYVRYELTDAVQKVADERVSEASKEAARANESAAKANERTASLEKDAAVAGQKIAEANARALEAQLALERFKAPRQLSSFGRTSAVAALRAYSGTTAAIYVLAEGPEANNLAIAVRELLTQCDWTALTWSWTGAGSATGVVVMVKPDADAKVRGAARALVSALDTADVASIEQAWPGEWGNFAGMLNGPPNPVAAPPRIVIGSKPQ